MKRSTAYKFLSCLSLVLVLISYNQCITPMDGAAKSAMKFQNTVSNPTNTGGVVFSSEEIKQISISDFKTTVYTVTRAHCISCHGTTQTPLHAAADVTTAHDAVINSYKVNFNDIPNSRLVLKLKNDLHNCWSNCANDAAEMQSQITEWKRLNDAQAPSSGNTPAVSGQVTPETNTIDYILSPEHMVDVGTISFLAESASLKTPMVKGTDSASGLTYVGVPNSGSTTPKTTTATDAGAATYSFKLTAAGTYKIWMLVYTPDTNSDSVFIKVNALAYKEWDVKTPPTTGFQWREVTTGTGFATTTFALPAGTSTLEIRDREDGMRISKIIVSNEAGFDPNVNVNFKSTIIMPIDDLSGVSGSTFNIDIENFDTYSYKVSNPRIITSTPLNVKNLKILVNGTFNPQHSTYTVVNKQVSMADPKVSNYTMVILKDKGSSIDKLSFAFGYLGTGTAPVEDDPTTPTNPTNPTNPTVLSSAEGFKQTLWPVLRTRCVNCHATSQVPFHANADYNVAHSAVIDNSLVNFTNVANSTIVNKVKNGHMCWSGDCNSDSAELATQINVWKNLSGK